LEEMMKVPITISVPHDWKFSTLELRRVDGYVTFNAKALQEILPFDYELVMTSHEDVLANILWSTYRLCVDNLGAEDPYMEYAISEGLREMEEEGL
jgi:hypothetical protein